MDILGIGLPELIAIFIIIILVLGPDDIQKVGLKIGKTVRKINTSDDWKALKRLSKEIRTLPNRLAREAELDELKKQFEEDQTIGNLKNALNLQEDLNLEAWTKPPGTSEKSTKAGDESIHKPSSKAE